MSGLNVVLLGGDSESTWIVANEIERDIGLDAIIIEGQDSRVRLLRRRAYRIGVWAAIGQAVFVIYSRLLEKYSKNRAVQIRVDNRWSLNPPENVPVHRVPSVNSDENLSVLRILAPKIIVVNGTRIISKRILEGIGARFINMHAGITPKYRGVHGAYWALANGDAENAGVTIHLVDAGIDTGGILHQARIRPEPVDNFCTYPLLQLAAGIPLLKLAIREALEGRLRVVTNGLSSRLYYHPTIWTYLKNRSRGVS